MKWFRQQNQYSSPWNLQNTKHAIIRTVDSSSQKIMSLSWEDNWDRRSKCCYASVSEYPGEIASTCMSAYNIFRATKGTFWHHNEGRISATTDICTAVFWSNGDWTDWDTLIHTKLPKQLAASWQGVAASQLSTTAWSQGRHGKAILLSTSHTSLSRIPFGFKGKSWFHKCVNMYICTISGD